MKAWAGVAVDLVALVFATGLLALGRITEGTWAAVAVPIVAYWLRARLRPGQPPSGGAALFVLLALTGAMLGRGGESGT